MHAGDKPYVVSPTGQVDLATRGLALDAVNGIVNQLLPQELQQALDEFGAVQHELAPLAEFPGEHFTIVAARGGDDVWVEIRRRRIADDDRVPEELFNHVDVSGPAPYPVYASAGSPSLSVPVEPLPDSLELDDIGPVRDETSDEDLSYDPIRPATPYEPPPADVVYDVMRQAQEESATDRSADTEPVQIDVLFTEPIEHREPAEPVEPREPREFARPESQAAIERKIEEAAVSASPVAAAPQTPAPVVFAAPELATPPLPPPVAPPAVMPPVAQAAPIPLARPVVHAVPTPVESRATEMPPAPAPAVSGLPRFEPPAAAVPFAVPSASPAAAPFAPAAAPFAPAAFEPPAKPSFAAIASPVATPISTPIERTMPVAPPHDAVPPAAPQPAVVLPLARNPIRAEQPLPPLGDDRTSGLDRLLRLSAARGASTMYLSSDSRPGVRVDGELQVLEGEPVLTARDVESLLLTLMPERNHEALRTGAATEWILDIEDVGRVRCMSFRDHRGPGGVFRLMPTRSVSVDQLGLPRAVQGLAIEPEGLVLVAGPRSSGKRTLISAFVDLINRTRRDHVITIEREINIVHERGSSFISQREVRGGDDDLLAAARAALREDPDVLVIEDLRSAGLMTVALEASASGHLVVGGFAAHTATATVDRIIDLYSPDHRRQVQLGLADSLRGVVVQVLLRKTGGGRVAAREVLLNTPAVSSVIAEGKTSQLPMAIEGGRRYGMMPLNDALVGLVQQGVVDGREAYRYASDRQGLLAALKHQGLDTSFVERLA